MSGHVSELLPELVLGALPPGVADEAERHLATCAACRSERAALADLVADFALEAHPTPPPSPSVRARLLAEIDGADRFAPFAPRFAELFQLDAAASANLLAEAARGEGYEPSPVPHARFKHFRPGPALAGCDAGFVHVRAGTTFPRHRHGGDEHTFVVQGLCQDHLTGRTLPPGEVMLLGPGTEHDFDAAGDEDLVFAVLLLAGVEFGI